MRHAVVLVSALVLSGCGFSTVSETRHLSAAYQPGTTLLVTTENGSVIVEPDGGADVRIEAEVSARNEERLADVEVTAQQGTDRVLRVTATFPGGRQSSEGCSYIVRMPAVAGVTVRTSNGSVKVNGSRGTASLSTSNGRVELTDHVGPAEVRSSNGSLSVKGELAAIKAHTSNGRITVRGAAGPVDLESSNGSIDLGLGDDFAGPVEVATSNGRIRCYRNAGVTERWLSGRSGRVSFGEGPGSRAVTSNGSITIR